VSADLGVVVVTHNSADVVGPLLASLPGALAGLEAQVVVVDNDSADDTVALLRAQGVHVVEAANNGYAAGINRGVEHLTDGVPVLVLNPDLRLDPGAVRVMLDRLDDPGVGIVAPRILDGEGVLTPSLRREPSLPRALGLGFTGAPALSEDITDPATYEHAQEVGWATGAVLLVRRECHEILGGWDESFFLYSEETDFSLRAKDAGWRTVYEPGATAHHEGSASGWNDRLYTMQILNRVRLYGRRHRASARWLFYLLALMREGELAVRGRSEARAALLALLLPSRRPAELGLSGRVGPW
jgi:N-acetylglucosaminyl-diphospho-decaprenol L-rhamnosyltransferase